MKKILLTLLFLALFIWWSFADNDYISQNCKINTTNIICWNYKSYQDKIDTFFEKLEEKYSNTILNVKIRLILSKVKDLKTKYQNNWKYKWWVEFILEYIDYKWNLLLNYKDNQNDTETQDESLIWKIYINTLENNISLSVWSKKVDFLKFNIINETDEDIYLDFVNLTGDIEAVKKNSFRLFYDNNSKDLSNLSVKISKNTEKQFILNWDMADNFSWEFVIILNEFEFKNSKWEALKYNLNNEIIKWEYKIWNQDYVEEDSSNPVSDPSSAILVWDDEIAVASYKLRVKYMDCLIKELTLVNIWTGTQTEVNSSNYVLYDWADNNVSKVYIYTSSGKKLWEANMLNWLVNFQFAEPVLVPINEDFYLVVKVKLNTVSSINTTNRFIKFWMLRPGDSIVQNWTSYTTNIITKNTWVKISWLYIWSFDGSVWNLQVLRKSTLNISPLTQINHSLVSDAGIFWFNVLSNWDSSPAIKEFRFNVYVYNSPNQTNTFKILWNSFDLNINWTRLSSNDVKFYNTLGSCSDLWWSDITSNWDLSFVDTNNYQYCVRAVFDWNYNKWYTLTPSTNYEFKITADPVAFGEYSSVNASFEDLSNISDIGTYTTISNQKTSFVWSDNSADYLDLTLANWFNDYLLNLYNAGSWYINN